MLAPREHPLSCSPLPAARRGRARRGVHRLQRGGPPRTGAGFWSLDDHRGGPPLQVTSDQASGPQEVLAPLAVREAITPVPASSAAGARELPDGIDLDPARGCRSDDLRAHRAAGSSEPARGEISRVCANWPCRPRAAPLPRPASGTWMWRSRRRPFGPGDRAADIVQPWIAPTYSLLLTDQLRYPPSYESRELADYRRRH